MIEKFCSRLPREISNPMYNEYYNRLKAVSYTHLDVYKRQDKKVEISVELSSKNAWENSLMTYLDDIPFHYIGKGEQCIIKTKLALSHKKAKEANIILLEEPENHLSHVKLNQLISDIKKHSNDKQILISTHSLSLIHI